MYVNHLASLQDYWTPYDHDNNPNRHHSYMRCTHLLSLEMGTNLFAVKGTYGYCSTACSLYAVNCSSRTHINLNAMLGDTRFCNRHRMTYVPSNIVRLDIFLLRKTLRYNSLHTEVTTCLYLVVGMKKALTTAAEGAPAQGKL